MSLIVKRVQQALFEAASSANRFPGSGGGAGMQPMQNLGFAAGGNQGGYSTANSSTWADITNTSFTISVPRTTFFLYMIFATGHITAGAQTGYFRGNIVGFDVTASPWINSATVSNGMMWYGPYINGPIAPGTYTVKMQAATDANTTTLTIDQFFHQFLALG